MLVPAACWDPAWGGRQRATRCLPRSPFCAASPSSSSSRFLSSFSSLHEPSLRPHLRGASVSCLCCDISASSPQVEQPSKCGLPCRRPRYRPLCEGTPIFVRPSRGKWVLALPAVTSFGRLPEQSTTRNLDHRPLFFVIRLSARIAFQALLQCKSALFKAPVPDLRVSYHNRPSLPRLWEPYCWRTQPVKTGPVKYPLRTQIEARWLRAVPFVVTKAFRVPRTA